MRYRLNPSLIEKIKRKLVAKEHIDLNGHQIVLQFFEAHNHKDIEGLSMVFAENAQFFAPFIENHLVSREEIKQLYLQAFRQTPDRIMGISNLIHLENNIAVEWKLEGTNSNGKRVQISEAGFFEVKKGKIQEMRLYVDLVNASNQHSAP